MPRTPPPEEEAYQPEPGTLLLEDQTLRYGFIQLPKQVLYARNLSRDAKLLYAVLLGYAWQEGRCFPGYRRLCEDMGASENMVRKYMRELEAVNLLRQKRRGLGKTNIYTLRDLRTAKIEVQEPQEWGNQPRTAKFAVLEPQKSAVPEQRKTAVAEPAKSAGELKTVEEETEGIDPSNLRMASPQQKRERTTGRAPTLEPTTNEHPPESEHSKGGGGDVAPVYDEARQQLLFFVQDLARELNDSASLRSSTSRLANLHHQSGLALENFIEHLYAARAITQERTAAIRTPAATATGTWQKNKMAYFFAVLENQLGLRAPAASD